MFEDINERNQDQMLTKWQQDQVTKFKKFLPLYLLFADQACILFKDERKFTEERRLCTNAGSVRKSNTRNTFQRIASMC